MNTSLNTNTSTASNTNECKDDLYSGLEWPRAAGSFLQSPNNQTTVRTLPTFYISSLSPLSQLRPILPSLSKSHSLRDNQNSTRIGNFLQNANCPPWHDGNRDIIRMIKSWTHDQVGMQLFQLLWFVTILGLEMKSDIQGVPKKSIFLKFQDQKCIWKIWTVLDHVR